METPKEIFINIERTYETKDGTVVAMVKPYMEKQSDEDIKYLRADLVVEKKKLVAYLKKQTHALDVSRHSGLITDQDIRIDTLEAIITKIETL